MNSSRVTLSEARIHQVEMQQCYKVVLNLKKKTKRRKPAGELVINPGTCPTVQVLHHVLSEECLFDLDPIYFRFLKCVLDN